MFIEPIRDKDLGNTAYLAGSHETKIAALIDPRRDVDCYTSAAERLGVRISYVLETHLHADFISGAREIAARFGSGGRPVLVGASAEARLGFAHRPLAEGDRIKLGELAIEVLATPGHTPEHISFTLARPGTGLPAALFSGGALIVGGAARTDLLGDHLTETLARKLFHTMHDKLLRMHDEVGVYPTHGAGSFCAAPVSHERTSTIGRERIHNPLAQARSEAEFNALSRHGLPSYPPYFLELRPINQRGPKLLGELAAPAPLAPQAVFDWLRQGGAVLDARRTGAIAAGYIPGVYAISLNAPLITWAGWLIPFGTPLVLVSENSGEREEAARQLRRIGYDDLRGYLDGGIAAWEAAGLPLARIRKMRPAEMRERLNEKDAPLVLDVRQESEFSAGHIPGAVNIENGRLPYDDLPLPVNLPIAVHCQSAGGDRATAAISILARRGFHDLVQLDGGFSAWQSSGYEVQRGTGRD